MQHARTAGSFVHNTAKGFFAILLLLIAAVQTYASAVGGQTVSEPNLVVMTYNIRYGTANDGENSWANRKEMACDVLRRHNPDIVGLQEALRFQIDDIRAALPRYAEIGGGRDDGKTEGEYSAILYRKDRLDLDDSGTFWLSDTPETPGSITWGNACTRICTWGRFLRKDTRQAFYLFNTHLDHVSQYSRDRSAVLLAQRIRDRKHADPVLVTGDFNAGEDNPVVRYFKGEQELPATAATWQRILSFWWTHSACCIPTQKRLGHSTVSRAAPQAIRSTTSSPSRIQRCFEPRSSVTTKTTAIPRTTFP